MKKYLFVLPLLAIFVAGCTFSKNATTDKSLNSYTNNRYGFSIQYPSNWFIITENAENDFRPIGEEGDYIGADIYFSDSKPKQDNLIGIPPALTMYAFQTTPETTLESFSKSHIYFSTEQQKPLTINGLEAIDLVGAEFNHPRVIIKGGDKIFVFIYTGFMIPEGNEEIYRSIINSFSLKQ